MNPSPRLGLIALLVVALAGLGVWFMSGDLSAEDQVREVIQQVADGAEAADLKMSMEPFSESYSDPEGVDKKGIKGILFLQYQKRGPISVWMSPIQVVVDGETAHAVFEVGLVEGAEGMLAWPVGVETLHFEVDLVHEDGDWRIQSHTRQEVIGLPDTG